MVRAASGPNEDRTTTREQPGHAKLSHQLLMSLRVRRCGANPSQRATLTSTSERKRLDTIRVWCRYLSLPGLQFATNVTLALFSSR